MTFRKHYTVVVDPVQHTLSEYKSIAAARSNYCYFIKSGEKHCYYCRYLYRSCENCIFMKTDPFIGIKCALEDKFGSWKIGHYNRKPSKDDSESESESDSESESESESDSESES